MHELYLTIRIEIHGPSFSQGPLLDPAVVERKIPVIVGAPDARGMYGDDEVMGLFASTITQERFGAGRYEEAAKWARRSLERWPNELHAQALLVASCAHLGRLAEARAALAQLRSASPDFSVSESRLLFSGCAPEMLARLGDGLRRAGLES